MLDITKVRNPMLNLMPDIALRDPEAVYHEGVFYLYYTHVDVRCDDVTSTLHMCTSEDLVNCSAGLRVSARRATCSAITVSG